MELRPQEIGSLIKQQIREFEHKIELSDVGSVVTVGDGIARIYGLDRCMAGELLEFPGGVYGMALNLEQEFVGAVMLGPDTDIKEGDAVSRTGRLVSVPVGEALLGRVVNALGQPIDGKGEALTNETRPIESPAPGIIARQSVNRPLQTGIKAIDSMIPIGRGQRELIIGDRQTGKTAIALDTIVNQKGQGVICVYVAIGQKQSTVAQVVDTLEKNGALEYTIVVSASASELAPLQYIAPYSGCAMGEYFMEQGKDVLCVYDDLSKHAVPCAVAAVKAPPGTGGVPRRCVLPPFPAVGAGSEFKQGKRRRFLDCPAHHRDPGRGRVCVYPHQRNLHHRRTDLFGNRAVPGRRASGGQPGHLGVSGGRKRPDQGHETGGGELKAVVFPVPGTPGVFPV